MNRIISISGLLLLLSFNLAAQKAQVFNHAGTAIRGYDPVSYFTEGKPVKGNEHFSVNWNNANWIFSSKEHLDSFVLNPIKFAPQYGGYCAYGMSEAHKAPTEPEAWTIVDGKLFLNYNLKVKDLWNKNRQDRIEEANKNWDLLKDKE